MTRTRKSVAVALTAIAAIFMVQNFAIVEVNFLAWSVRLPRAILLLIVFSLGAVAALLVTGSIGLKPRK